MRPSCRYFRQGRWLELVEDYDYKILDYSYKANVVVDSLDRRHVTITSTLLEPALGFEIHNNEQTKITSTKDG